MFSIFARSAKTLSAVSLCAAMLLAAPAFAQDDKVVAKIGEMTITAAELDQALTDMEPQFRNVPEEQRRARALDSLIDIRVMAARAADDGLADDPALKRRIELLRNRALHNAYFQKNVLPTVTDEAIKERYDAEIAKTEPEQEVSARHILVKTEEEAKAIIEELNGGADFIELAKAKSTGPSGPQGGDLGYFGKGRMVPEFEEAAFALDAGDYTKEPVKSQFGFHVIKVDNKRDKPFPTLEASKERLRNLMLTEAYTKTVEESRAAVGVEIVDETLKLPQ
ncbi:MAG: peptidylprolyl isomerase [Ahrensia sp.]|nr:peptidylprolyl isomerase [Ahrensia sp.]